ncbi:hypothetical protein Vadar_030048 [Vaccinium darrowii]|uniref:Uncharacterized protein n=1 Tax=Vaccinium darrowii TaxID=229202 RepID=A0ACB7YRT6_9ERIC|nr:hypothetical protein Vadar_030048 [Vaccinium darrowii]
MATEVSMGKEKMMGAKILSKAHVKPKKPIGRRECQLVTYDLHYIGFQYIQKLLVYKGSDFEDRMERLKDGLGVVLGEFNQLAGKLGKDGDGVLRVEYDDDMDGVEVAAATAEQIEIADLIEEESACKLKNLVPYNGILNAEGLHSSTTVGSSVMGCAFNHAIVDGTSMWHFMSSWAEICNGSQTISVPPFLDRIKARNTRVKLNLPISSSSDIINLDPPLRMKIFKFSESAIDKIKAKANSNPNPSDGSKPISAFQSLSTHLWRAVTRARNLKPKDTTAFCVSANCRHRVDPPMPAGYFGNLIQGIVTGTSAGVLTENPPGFGAGMIQKAIEMHDAEAVDVRCRTWESNPRIMEWKDAGVNCVAVGSSPRFAVYDVDFGWGKPVIVRSGSNNRFDGMVYMHQGRSGGRSVDVDISLEASAMENLEKDEEFLGAMA